MGIGSATASRARSSTTSSSTPGFALVESTAPRDLVGKTLADAEVRKRYGVTVVCIKPAGGSFTYATPETVVQQGDVLVVAGEKRHAEAFGELTS